MILAIILIVGIVVLDQVTKLLVVSQLSYGAQVEIIPDFFTITHRVNSGAAWSILEGQMVIFYIVTVIALAVFGYMLRDADFKNKKMYSFGLVILIAGAIGNFIDRIRIQGVIDFLDFVIFGYDFPVFNVADVALNVGIAMFIIAVVFYEKD